VAAALIAASRALLQRSSPHDLFWVNTGNLDLRRQVGDKYATGTSAAMRYYLGAWSHVKELWRRHASLPPSEVVADVLVGERLFHRVMQNASFSASPVRCGKGRGACYGVFRVMPELPSIPGDCVRRKRTGHCISAVTPRAAAASESPGQLQQANP